MVIDTGHSLSPSSASTSGALLVPRIIQQTEEDWRGDCGIFGTKLLKRRWEKAVNGAFRSGRLDYQKLGTTIDLVPADSICGRLYVSNVPASTTGDFYFACVWPTIERVCRRGLKRGFERFDDDQWKIENARIQQCLVDGISEFWFCLGLLANHGLLASSDKPEQAAFILGGILRWWSDICRLGEKVTGYGQQWQDWGGSAVSWCIRMGVPDGEWQTLNEDSDAESVGRRMQEWKHKFDEGALPPPDF